jgi:hypothetical protein
VLPLGLLKPVLGIFDSPQFGNRFEAIASSTEVAMHVLSRDACLHAQKVMQSLNRLVSMVRRWVRSNGTRDPL